ncbi:hypothetical protein [Arsenicibacter rosenii]|uniref:Outer membrane protein beta-barrel domain-containing protein n=1 Tax=Arsenicibacter rosenii TaxID=1750698 RepID=A0A1S2VBQ4_9BACT|nr:hypothetical protein [Arsenicibacter rosenii]OIN55646.1 hypothetical protein BLX24_28950 [Arsenicibacter rosenii]
MSNERFDKFLKKNLEAVRPAYTVSAWERFRKKMPVPPLASWLLNYGGWVASSLLLSGWLVTFYLYWKQNETLKTVQKQINTLIEDRTLLSKKSQHSVITSPAEPLHRIDTVYIIHKTIIDTSKPVYASTKSAGEPTQPVTQRRRSEPVTGTTREPVLTRNEALSAIHQKSPLTETGDRHAYQRLKQGNAGQPTASARPSAHNSTFQDSLTKPVTTSVPTASADSAEVVAETQQPKTPDLSLPKAPPVSEAPMQPKKPEASKPPFSLRQLKPRIGIQGIAGLKGAGAGFVLDFQVADRTNLSFGLQAQHIHTENHHALDDYNSATGQDFMEIYRKYLPQKFDFIEGISISETFMTVPVSLNYYIPIRKAWSGFINAGTQLNLSGFQEVSFETYTGSRENHYRFDFRTHPDLFTNFVFGGGIQWQHKNIALQLGPSYKYIFHRDHNSAAKSSAGLNASMFINLFK